MSSDKKYKDFRNYMVNELGITRQDIEAWTKQSVATEVGKLVRQFNFEELVAEAINGKVRGVVSGTSHFSRGEEALRKEIAKQIVDKINLKLEITE